MRFAGIYRQLKSQTGHGWIKSHHDYPIYQKLIPGIGGYQDDEHGFQGP
ncbi:hypothetical protein [Acinetobacter sp. WZC-1]